MYIFPSTQAKEKANRAASTPPPSLTESLLLDIATSTTPKDKATSEESSALSSMTPEEAVLSLRSTSEILTNTKNKQSTSSLPKEPIPANTSSAEERRQSQQVTCSLSIKSQKVRPSATSSPLWEIRDHTLDVQAPTQLSSATPMMALKPE